MLEIRTNISTHEMHSFMNGFYDQYSRYVYKLAWQYCSSIDAVDDLVQDVWLRLCTKAELLYGLSQARQLTYIATTIRNTVISLSRKARPECSLEIIHGIGYNEADVLNVIFDRKLSVERFREIWKLVPGTARELLERKYLLEESDAEIANILGIGVGSVRIYLSRARKTAFDVLSKYKEKIL